MAKSFTEDGAAGAADAGISPNVAGSNTAPAMTGVAGTSDAVQGIPSGDTNSGILAGAPPSSGGGSDSSANPGFNEQMPSGNYYARFAQAGQHGAGMFFADGGVVGDDGSSDPSQPMGGFDPSNALAVVDQALTYGRQLHGLSGDDGGINDQQAANMPAVPGNPSDSGMPRPQPMPGQLPPTGNPFGKRMASNMPTTPGSQSNSGIRPVQPMPGQLPPTSNPFGKRADAGIDDGSDQEDNNDVDG